MISTSGHQLLTIFEIHFFHDADLLRMGIPRWCGEAFGRFAQKVSQDLFRLGHDVAELFCSQVSGIPEKVNGDVLEWTMKDLLMGIPMEAAVQWMLWSITKCYSSSAVAQLTCRVLRL